MAVEFTYVPCLLLVNFVKLGDTADFAKHIYAG